ncbi:phage holin family protein [Lapillicoccus sp.]|uniref:phage holin family protein n=1 Tax=Lapillicoccus sp. TaxID=1909287 RepID=UPI0032648A65
MANHESSSQARTLGQLVAQVTEDLSVIVRTELQLAKVEITTSLGIAGKGAGLLAGAGVVALYALGLLFVTLALVIAIWLPVWAGFLIITVVLLIVAAILGILGRKALQKVDPKPERAIARAQETIAAIKGASASGAEHAKAVPAANAQVALDAGPEQPRDR